MKLKILLIMLLVMLLTLRYANTVFIYFENSLPSESSGPISGGSLLNGKRLPMNGENFRACSWILATLGRNSVHEKVRSSMLDSYNELVILTPQSQFVYGETGWPRGGNFCPHKTHQNGLSVDFMVPVTDLQGYPASLGCHIFNRWGYAIEFSKEGKTGKYMIDFEAMAAQLLALEKHARKHGLRIIRVIFDVDFHPLLFKTSQGKKLKQLTEFPLWKPLVRHDEHYRADFELLNKK